MVLGLIFLKYISDAFEEKHEQLRHWSADPSSDWYVKDPEDRYTVTEDRDGYLAENIFWVPPEHAVVACRPAQGSRRSGA